jgi:hypothetical protein
MRSSITLCGKVISIKHVPFKEQTRNAYKILIRKREGKRPFWMP